MADASKRAVDLVDALADTASAHGRNSTNEDRRRASDARNALLAYIAEQEGKAAHRAEVAEAARRGFHGENTPPAPPPK